jgi:hypothetical protein
MYKRIRTSRNARRYEKTSFSGGEDEGMRDRVASDGHYLYHFFMLSNTFWRQLYYVNMIFKTLQIPRWDARKMDGRMDYHGDWIRLN